MPVPAGGENTLSVNDWSPGAPPPMILIRTTVATAMIRSTVTPSIESRIRVAVWAGEARQGEGTGEGDDGDEELRPQRVVVPDADLVEERGAEDAGRRARDAGVKRVGAHSDQPARTPKRGPSVAPTNPNTDPAWL